MRTYQDEVTEREESIKQVIQAVTGNRLATLLSEIREFTPKASVSIRFESSETSVFAVEVTIINGDSYGNVRVYPYGVETVQSVEKIAGEALARMVFDAFSLKKA